jgi:hypothetical protein
MRTLFALVFGALLLAACAGEDRGAAGPTVVPGEAAGPTLGPGEACPTARGRVVNADFGPAIGRGPVYAAALGTDGVLEIAPAENFDSHEWAGQKVLWVVDKSYDGPVVIRGQRLDGPGIVRFDEGDVPPALISIGAGGGGYYWRNRPSYTRVQGPGCYAWEVEGDGFAYPIVFLARRMSN